MSPILQNCDERVHFEPAEDGGNIISVYPEGHSTDKPQGSWQTSYPLQLVQLICDLKGADSLIDDIRRDEDPLYVQACLEKDILAYITEDDLKGKTLLDFGCGSGASTMILARMFPDTEIVGIDLSEDALTIARARAEYYRFEHIRFMCSPAGDQLPGDIGDYDYIMFSAVFEHLLPNERRELLPKVWDLLKVNGVLFLDQTPWRFFPLEGHTTRLPFVNYLPSFLALPYARMFSRRVKKYETWQGLLRRGIRGGTVGEIMKILNEHSGGNCKLLKPGRLGIKNRVDLWWAGYAVSIARKHPRFRIIQGILYGLLKTLCTITPIEITPSLSLAIRKKT